MRFITLNTGWRRGAELVGDVKYFGFQHFIDCYLVGCTSQRKVCVHELIHCFHVNQTVCYRRATCVCET